MAKRTFKSTGTISGGQQNYRKWEEWEVGDILIGKFKKMHIDQYKKECPVMEIVDAQFKDDSGVDKYAEGKTLVLNACGMLDKAMENVLPGEMVQITYTGKSKIEKGPFAGKDSHTMLIDKVEFDEGSPAQADPEL